jgi:hypothetical protein
VGKWLLKNLSHVGYLGSTLDEEEYNKKRSILLCLMSEHESAKCDCLWAVEHEDGAQDVGEGCDPVEEVN